MSTSEKITINLEPVDLGKIDLLVQQGFYATRTDLIKHAIRRLLDEHKDAINEQVQRHNFVMGIVSYNRADLERKRAKGERLTVTVIGQLHLSQDITPELADAVFGEIRLVGSLRAPDAVCDRLKDKITAIVGFKG